MRKNLLKRFIEGDDSFSLAGGFPELFLRLCRNKKITLREVKVEGNTVTGKVNRKDEEAFLQAADEAGMEILGVRKFGLRYLLRRYKNRIGIPVGILMFVLILRILSSVLWSVDVHGLVTLNEEDFLSYLNTIHIRKGIPLSEIDCNAIEEEIELFDEAVLRCAVNLVGCKLYIVVEEREMPPEIAERDRYCNVIARKSGEVLSADILAGEGKIHPGDMLQAGDMIAAGVIPLKNGGVRLLEARAVVMAKTETVFRSAAETELSVKTVKRVTDRYSIVFFGLKIPSYKEPYESTAYFTAEETVFPMGVSRCRSTALEDRTVTFSVHEASLLAMSKLACAVSSEFWNTKIIGCNANCSRGSRYEITAQLFCEENIAQQQLFEIISDKN